MRQQQSYYPFSGGLDQETPAIAMPPGRVIAVQNYESSQTGYSRIEGYERYDGHPSPSRLIFQIGQFSGGLIEILPGDTIDGAASGAQAKVLSVDLTSGDWLTDDAAGTIVIEDPTGEFEVGEDLGVSAVKVAELSAAFYLGNRASSDIEMDYWLAATASRRSAIAAVPGSGPVRGVVWYGDNLYAWRDNVGATAGKLWKATASGWAAVDLGKVLPFDTSTAQILVGNNVVGGTSGATGVVRAVANLSTNDWPSGANGVLILDSVTGTWQDNEAITVSASSKALVNGTLSTYAIPPGGRYRFVRENFYGSVGTERVYGVNGVGKAFDFDGASVIEIPTGMPDDKPFLIAEFKKQLFLGFPKGSLQNSGLGEPRLFSAILGAEEIGMGQELTNLLPNSADTLLVTTAKSIGILSGNNASDFTLQTLSEETGARPNTAAWIGDVLYMDERGIRSVAASQRYGNFSIGTFTQLIQKELKDKRRAKIDPVEAITVKAKDSYLLFFADGSAIPIYIGRKNPEPMLLKYPFQPTCFWTEEIDGEERVFTGAADGFVYEMNAGPSFDGEAINAFMQFPFAHQQGPRVLKRYHKASFECEAPPGSSISAIAQFDYGAGLQPFAADAIFDIVGGSGGTWGVSDWGEFFWGLPLVGGAEVHIQGVGQNMSLTIASNSAVLDSHTFQGVTLAYSVRGQKR